MFSHPDAMRIYTTEAVGTIFGTLARFFRIANSTPKGAQPTPADGVIAMPVSERIIRLPTVLNRTGLSRSTLYRKIAEGTFPAQVQISVHGAGRSEEHTSELQSLMRISYAVFCLKKKNKNKHK